MKQHDTLRAIHGARASAWAAAGLALLLAACGGGGGGGGAGDSVGDASTSTPVPTPTPTPTPTQIIIQAPTFISVPTSGQGGDAGAGGKGGNGQGGSIIVRNAQGVEQKVQVFEPAYTGPINTTVTPDLNNDGSPDYVCAPGQGGSPRISIRDGSNNTEQKTFFAYDPNFTGGVSVASGQINGTNALITGAGPGGGPHMKIFNLSTGQEMFSSFMFAPAFTGGISVSLSDADLDGTLDIVVAAGLGGGPHVKILNGRTLEVIREFFAFDPSINLGVSLFTGNFDSDAGDEIVVALGAGGPSLIRIFDLATGRLEREIEVFEPGFTGGVKVGASDYNHDGKLDLLAGAGPGGAPRVRVYNNDDYAIIDDFFAGDQNLRNGVSF